MSAPENGPEYFHPGVEEYFDAQFNFAERVTGYINEFSTDKLGVQFVPEGQDERFRAGMDMEMRYRFGDIAIDPGQKLFPYSRHVKTHYGSVKLDPIIVGETPDVVGCRLRTFKDSQDVLNWTAGYVMMYQDPGYQPGIESANRRGYQEIGVRLNSNGEITAYRQVSMAFGKGIVVPATNTVKRLSNTDEMLSMIGQISQVQPYSEPKDF